MFGWIREEAIAVAELETLSRIQRTQAVATGRLFRKIDFRTESLGQGGEGSDLLLLDIVLVPESVAETPDFLL